MVLEMKKFRLIHQKNILILGDSFVEGAGIENELERFSNIVREKFKNTNNT